MVQMLVSVLCRKASRRRSKHHSVSDDPFKLAAGLRMHKSEKAFSGMADDFEHYIDQLDVGASMNKFFVIYGAIETWTDVVPGLPVQMKHLKKQELGKHLDVMHLTLGNRRKARERATAVKAQIAKAKGRWNVLSSLLAPEDADEEGSAIARKLRSVMRGGQRLRLMPSIADLATVVVQKQEAERKEVIAALLQKQEQEEAAAAAAALVAAESKQLKRSRSRVSLPSAISGNGSGESGASNTAKVGAAPHKQKRTSCSLTLLDREARDPFHVNEGDSLMKKVAKLSLLEDSFASLAGTPKELKRLWNDADNNGNGDLSLSEWQGYAGQKFNVLSSSRANKKAFSEAASVGPPGLASPAASTPPEKAAASLEKDGHDIAVATAGGVDDSTVESAAPPALWKETLGGLSMPILNRSKLTGRFSVFEGDPSLEEKEDATGLLVDIDVFCDLVLQCHYKTRSAGIVHLIR